MKQTFFVLLFVSFSSFVLGVVANPEPFFVLQGDGQRIEVVQKGNEWNNWIETIDGYPIEKNKEGWWVYSGTFGKPVAKNGTLKVGIDNPRDLVKRNFNMVTQEVPESARHPIGLRTAGGLSNYKVLVLLVEFSDQSPVGTVPADWSKKVFRNTIDSLAAYYHEISFGQFSITTASESHGVSNDGVVGWLKLDYNHPDPGGHTDERNQQITTDAILAADPYVDFSCFDSNGDKYVSKTELGIIVVVAGYEASIGKYSPSVWSHQCSLESRVPAIVCDEVKVGGWMGTSDIRNGGYMQIGEWHQSNPNDGHMAAIGIMAHELGHKAFDLWDQNDYDPTARFRNTGLMGDGAWGKAQPDTYPGTNPAHMGIQFKTLCGFVNLQMKLIPGVENDNLNKTLSSGFCWTDDHAPPPHTSHSGSPANCWSFAAIKAFKNKYPQKFSNCNPTINTSIDAFDDQYFYRYTYSASSVAAGDVVGTGSSGVSHAAFVYEVLYPADDYINIVDSNRIPGWGVTYSTLEEMEGVRGEQVTKIYRPKNIIYPPSSSPSLLNPASGSYFIGTTHTLDWSGGYTSYTLRIDTSSGFPSPNDYTSTSSSKQKTFTRGYNYYWKVRGFNSCGPGPFSSHRWLIIKSNATYAMTFGYHGPYTFGGHTVHKIAVTFTDGSLDDLSYVNIYKKLGSGSWQFLESINASWLPYTYEGPEITMVDNVPVKNGTKISYKGTYYTSSGQNISGENWDYCWDF